MPDEKKEDSITEIMDRIAKARARSGTLQTALARSLAIQTLWPDAFRAGPVYGWWTSKGRLAEYTLIYHLRDTGGNEVAFTYEDVPEVLQATAPLERKR